MKFSVLALDYDGTIARDGRLDSDVRTSIVEARAHGIAVVIVTGRILSDLRKVAGGLDFVDAVVAENGAVLALPNANIRLIGQPPPSIFLQELRRRGIAFTAGQCVVETQADAAPPILSIIRQLELPLVLLFNRGRLMVLPQGISKGIGLREALTLMRFSTHNAIAIGDAENDHSLLDACEFGVAVAWGSKELQAAADDVLAGEGPSAVASYVRKLIKAMRIPLQRIDRARVVLGTTEDGYPLAMGMHGRNVLICGDPRSGKSWVAGLICEQTILQGYTLCVIDAEGDYRTLGCCQGLLCSVATIISVSVSVSARVSSTDLAAGTSSTIRCTCLLRSDASGRPLLRGRLFGNSLAVFSRIRAAEIHSGGKVAFGSLSAAHIGGKITSNLDQMPSCPESGDHFLRNTILDEHVTTAKGELCKACSFERGLNIHSKINDI